MNKTEQVKEWYVETFKTDELGAEIKEKITFEHLYIALKNKHDIYNLLGVQDSLVRERLFNELSCRKEIDGEEIYNMWIDGV